MDQTTMLDTDAALQPLLQMAKESSKNNDTNRTLVMKALSDPTIFCGFDQIKAALELLDDHVLGRTLNLFSFGGYSDYTTAEPGTFMSLSDAQVLKLRQLTVLSIVQQACFDASPVIPYTTLSQALDIDNQIGVVEEILVSCIYSGMVGGQLCQQSQSFLLSSTMPFRSRDVPPSQTKELLDRLTNFRSQLEGTIEDMTQATGSVQSQKHSHEAFWKQHEFSGNQKPSATDRFPGFRSRERPTARASNKRSRGGLASAEVARF
jgi:hypothetical protein